MELPGGSEFPWFGRPGLGCAFPQLTRRKAFLALRNDSVCEVSFSQTTHLANICRLHHPGRFDRIGSGNGTIFLLGDLAYFAPTLLRAARGVPKMTEWITATSRNRTDVALVPCRL
jgi:hypothetical protein